MKEDSGRLIVEEDRVCYESTTYGNWRIPASSIRLIGEYTNQSGPYLDDYFFVFVTKGEVGWSEASFYCQGRDEAWKNLAELFPGLASPGLCNSADFKSRALWPHIYEGREFLRFQPMKRGTRWHDRILDLLCPPFVVEASLMEEFMETPVPPEQPLA
jgi:hypothetical protein